MWGSTPSPTRSSAPSAPAISASISRQPIRAGGASRQFLAHAAGLVAARGGRVAHVDVTLICERPKIGPHRQAMTDCVAEILGLEKDRVSIKATTTERLGFTGRGEGIAAQAVATIRMGRP